MTDPIDRLLDAAESGKSIIKNREILHFTYIPEIIQHRDSEQEQVTQSLLPILKKSRPYVIFKPLVYLNFMQNSCFAEKVDFWSDLDTFYTIWAK